VSIRISREKIKKVFVINCFLTSWMIDTFIVPLERKLQKVFVNLAQISTNNPLQVNINTCLLSYFSQVGIHFAKFVKHPYVDGKLL
jgi:hypothetical protein